MLTTILQHGWHFWNASTPYHHHHVEQKENLAKSAFGFHLTVHSRQKTSRKCHVHTIDFDNKVLCLPAGVEGAKLLHFLFLRCSIELRLNLWVWHGRIVFVLQVKCEEKKRHLSWACPGKSLLPPSSVAVFDSSNNLVLSYVFVCMYVMCIQLYYEP